MVNYLHINNSKDIYGFDLKGSVTRHKNFNKWDKLNHEFVNEYDGNGLLVEQLDLISKSTWCYEYDSKKRMTKEIEKSCNEQLEGIVEYLYNEKDLVICENNYDEEGELDYSEKYIYNDHGDIIYQKVEGGFESELRFEYEYDSNNNWVKQFSITEGRRKLEVQKLVVYY